MSESQKGLKELRRQMWAFGKSKPSKTKLDIGPHFSPAQIARLVKGAQTHLKDTLETPEQTAWLDTVIEENPKYARKS
jgi:hypothetical protein